jgi:hypothetical protein
MPTAQRTARCTYYRSCGNEAPSVDRARLAFFEDLSAGRTSDHCRRCGYAEIAHRRFSGELMDIVTAGRWPRGVTPHTFDAKTEGEPFDRYYCGCFGWD